MPSGMRAFIPHGKYPHVSTVLFEQYGLPAEEIAERFFSANHDPSGQYASGNYHCAEFTDYFYMEFMPLMIEQGYYREATEQDIVAGLAVELDDPVPTDSHKFLKKALDRKDVVDMLSFDVLVGMNDEHKWKGEDGDTVMSKYTGEQIQYIYAAAKYIGELNEQQRAFEDSRHEAVIVPPLFDESFFSYQR